MIFRKQLEGERRRKGTETYSFWTDQFHKNNSDLLTSGDLDRGSREITLNKKK